MMDFGFSQAELAWGDSVIGEADIRRVLQGIVDIGGSRVRFGVGWNLIEKTRGQYDFSVLDRAVTLCAQYGVKPLLNVQPAGSTKGGGDGTPADLGDFCKALALRYGPSGSNLVDAYEIWNEENWSQFFVPTSQAAYMEYLKPAYDNIKAVHPSATVITGGTTPGATYSGNVWFAPWVHFDLINHIDWYTGLYNLGVQNYCDGIGIHWYSNADDWSREDPASTQIDYVRVQAVRDLMVAKGDDDKQIWLTEFGFPQADGLVKARDRLKMQADMIDARPWIGPAFLYSYRNVGTDLSNPNNGYGVVDYQWQRKSPYYELVASWNADTTPPTAPTGLASGDVTATSARLTWAPATDDVGVTNYRVYNTSGQLVADVIDTTAVMTNLLPALSQGFYVTALDHAGNESAASDTLMVTTEPPDGRQEFFHWAGDPTVSLPTQFLQIGLGFTVPGSGPRAGLAVPNQPSTDGEYWTVAPYFADQASADHSSRVTIGETVKAYGATGALAIVRMSLDGQNFVAAASDWGGTDSIQIITCINGVVTARAGANRPGLQHGEELWLTAVGNTYTVTTRRVGAQLADVVSWNDTTGVYSGRRNVRAGMGWLHRRVGSVFNPQGIQEWRGLDVAPVEAQLDSWPLAMIDELEWVDYLATGAWETLI